MCCFNIDTSDLYDEIQGQIEGRVTLTYLPRSQRLINLGSYNLYRFHIHRIGPIKMYPVSQIGR